MPKTESTISSPKRLKAMLQETEAELAKIQPRLTRLEKYADELAQLRITKQRLLTLKMSLATMLETTMSEPLDRRSDFSGTDVREAKLYSFSELSALKSFYPDDALKTVETILRQKQSLNYEMFKAVVFKGGKASTEEIKAYLVETGVKQPQTGEGFESVPLTEISSRANYLVRKGVLQPAGRGQFFTPLGWRESG